MMNKQVQEPTFHGQPTTDERFAVPVSFAQRVCAGFAQLGMFFVIGPMHHHFVTSDRVPQVPEVSP